MTRANVISINSPNYGNRLQAYALHQVLHRELGEDARVESLQISGGSQTPPLWRRAAGKIWRTVKGICSGSPTLPDNRLPLFASFTAQHIPSIYAADAAAVSARSGIFVIGSDQCWNLSWEVGARTDGAQCATGVAGARKLAYAASFGLTYEAMTREWREAYATWLAEFAPNTISVREDAGAECVYKLCGAKAQVVLDPTMLLATQDWEALERRPEISGIDEPFCLKYVLGEDANSEHIDKVCTERGLHIIDLRNTELPVGPAEFLWLIHHSQLVCADSFHAAVFSILFKRPFAIYERQEKGVCDMSCRFDTLARMFGIEDHRANGPVFSWNAVWECDWANIDARLETERAASLTWLREALAAMSIDEPAPCVDLDASCCGCGACAASCPTSCITLEENAAGFQIPSVDAHSCTGCGTCRTVCPALAQPGCSMRPNVYWAAAKDAAHKQKSSSGGIFGMLAQQTLERGGVVYGAVFADGCKRVEHMRAATPAALKKIMQSKYVQSTIPVSVYRALAADLAAGLPVIFSGTACQVAGVSKYLHATATPTEHLLLVDVVCHGVPSPKLWREWLEHKQTQLGCSLDSVNFRCKTPSWESYSVVYQSGGSAVETTPFERDGYMKAFLQNAALRPSCFECPAKLRCGSDITLGDFWGFSALHPEVDCLQGISAVLANTSKGDEALAAILPATEHGPASFEDVLRGNPSLGQSVPPHANYAAFMRAVAAGASIPQIRKL